MKKKVIQINFSNKVFYTLILILGIVVFGGIVFATLQTAPTYGHSVSELQKCGANEVLKMNSAGTAWACELASPATVGRNCTKIYEKRYPASSIWEAVNIPPYCYTDGLCTYMLISSIPTYRSEMKEVYQDSRLSQIIVSGLGDLDAINGDGTDTRLITIGDTASALNDDKQSIFETYSTKMSVYTRADYISELYVCY